MSADVRVTMNILLDEIEAIRDSIPDSIGHLQSVQALLRWSVAKLVGEDVQPCQLNTNPFRRNIKRPKVRAGVATVVVRLHPDAMVRLAELAPPQYRDMNSQLVRWAVVRGVMGLQGSDLDRQMSLVVRGGPRR